jgi:hypothetical protein
VFHVCACVSCVSFLWYPVSVCDVVCLAVCMCMCVCAHKCVRPRACERGAVCVCDVVDVDIGKRAHLCAPLHVPMCAVVCAVRDGVRARRHTTDAGKASDQSRMTAWPVYESSEDGQESAYED